MEFDLKPDIHPPIMNQTLSHNTQKLKKIQFRSIYLAQNHDTTKQWILFHELV